MTNVRLWERMALLYVIVTTAGAGGWALFLPRLFYDSFPGFGRVWVAVDGPYNEHLVRDVGALQLALTLLAVISYVAKRLAAVQTVAICVLIFNFPHFLYHMLHLHMLPSLADQILM